jgi:hypothetical protein
VTEEREARIKLAVDRAVAGTWEAIYLESELTPGEARVAWQMVVGDLVSFAIIDIRRAALTEWIKSA